MLDEEVACPGKCIADHEAGQHQQSSACQQCADETPEGCSSTDKMKCSRAGPTVLADVIGPEFTKRRDSHFVIIAPQAGQPAARALPVWRGAYRILLEIEH